MGEPTKSSTVILQLKPLRENERGIEYWSTFLRVISSIKGSLQFFVMGNNRTIQLLIVCDRNNLSFIENIFYSNFPNSELNIIDIPLPFTNEYLVFDKKTIFRPVESYVQGGTYKSPFQDILSLFNTVDQDSTLTIGITIKFKQEISSRDKAIALIKKLFGGGKKAPSIDDGSPIKSLETITPELRARISININTTNLVLKNSIKDQYILLLNSFTTAGGISYSNKPTEFVPFLRSQIANFFHVPIQTNFTKALDYAVYRKLPYPYPIPTEDTVKADEFTLIGRTDYRNDNITFGMIEEDKFRHMYIIGKTGTGKSTFLSNLITNDIKNGKGVGLLDPHGELVETVLEHIPTHRTNDVILFDIADSEYPIGFNLLQAKNEDEKNLIVSGVVTTFQKLFANSWGPRLEYILRNVLLSLVNYPNATLMHVLRILTDSVFREEVIRHTSDTMLIKFRKEEYNKWDERQKQEAMGPIVNKIGQFLSSTIVRNIFGQPKSKLNLREAMDSGKILLINLSKGKIGEDNANMIGSLLVTKFQIDAMSRADQQVHERVPFFLYIDEFQNFATDSFATILSEARKYKLSLIMANQYIGQLIDSIKNAIFGNIGSIFSFTIGYDDAQIISNQFKELVTTNDLISLPRFTAYTRMMINGITSDPFSIKTMPLSAAHGSAQQTQKIIEQSRARYAMPRQELEQLLNAWQKKNFSESEKIALRSQLEGQGIPAPLINEFLQSGEDNWKLWYQQKIKQNPELAKSKQQTPTITPATNTTIHNTNIPQAVAGGFTINNITLGQQYEGYVKLLFNYGIFVTVKGVEGLVHKNDVVVPEGINWKKYFNIGDPINVIAKEFKDVNGEKKVVWTMK